MADEIGDDEPIRFSGRVYFITAEASGTVKVGYSKNLGKRLIDLQTSSSVKLRLDFFCAGGRDLERALHAFLAPYRVSGEWFRDGDHIRDLTDELALFIDCKADEEDIGDDMNVVVSADDFRKIIEDPHYGMGDEEIRALACGKAVDNPS